MLIDRVTKETTDYTRVDMDMSWWLDPGECLTAVVSSEISLGTTGWSEAPYPPPGSPPPYDPTPLLFISVEITDNGTGLTAFVEYGTPGNVYTCTFILDGTSTRRVTIELGVQISGQPPVQSLPLPILPAQVDYALSIYGGTLLGPLYLFEDPLYPTEAATKAYVDQRVGTSGVTSFNSRSGAVFLTPSDITAALAYIPYNAANPAGFVTASGASAAAPVRSVAGRVGAVTLTHTDITDWTNTITSALAPYALAASVPAGSNAPPLMDGVANAGVLPTWTRSDHIHPIDVSRYAASNPSGYQTAAQLSAAISAAAYVLPTASTTALGGVKVDGTTVTIASGVISAAVSGGGIPDAPSTGIIFGRMNATWVAVPVGSGGIVDAPNDGTSYGRKSLGWTHLTHADITDWASTLASYAPLASPVFSGTPSLPAGTFGVTQAPGASGTSIATTAFVAAAVSAGTAGLVNSFNTRIGSVTLNNADVLAVLPGSLTLPLVDGTASAGTGTTWARADHVHPVDLSMVAVSDTPPAGARDNTFWFDSSGTGLYIKYNDGSSTQWVLTVGHAPAGYASRAVTLEDLVKLGLVSAEDVKAKLQ